MCSQAIKLNKILYPPVNDIQHITIYVVGSKADLSEACEFVQEKFNNKVPAETLLVVSLLGHENQLVEVDAIIIKKCT